MNRFAYWRDPLCLACSVLYALNRWLLKPHFPLPFLRNYFNDCLLIPCALPWVLWLHRRLGLRPHDTPPRFSEVALHVVVWSLVCELIGPWFLPVTGDPKDVLAYAAGGVAAWIWWL